MINKALEKDRDLRYQHALELRADLKRLKRNTDSDRVLTSGSRAAHALSAEVETRSPVVQPTTGLARKQYVAITACLLLLAAAFATYHFWPHSKPSSGPGKITQISQWNKPMNDAKLSSDGHAVAFTSSVGGVTQVFLMLSSGGEPLQLTSEEGEKDVDNFSADGKEIFYERSGGRDEVWAVPALGGAPRRVHGVPSRGQVTIYRQPWKDGKNIGPPQVALKVPFAFPLRNTSGSAYDFSRDLSTIVYARPGGHADLYLLSQK